MNYHDYSSVSSVLAMFEVFIILVIDPELTKPSVMPLVTILEISPNPEQSAPLLKNHGGRVALIDGPAVSDRHRVKEIEELACVMQIFFLISTTAHPNRV